VDIPADLVRQTVKEIGYTRAKFGFDGDTCAVVTAIDEQSPDIALGVNEGSGGERVAAADPLDLIGAGDQGMVFGYACNGKQRTLCRCPSLWLITWLGAWLLCVRKTALTALSKRPDGKDPSHSRV
jgi:S-adenosylmethionine synthetase